MENSSVGRGGAEPNTSNSKVFRPWENLNQNNDPLVKNTSPHVFGEKKMEPGEEKIETGKMETGSSDEENESSTFNLDMTDVYMYKSGAGYPVWMKRDAKANFRRQCRPFLFDVYSQKLYYIRQKRKKRDLFTEFDLTKARLVIVDREERAKIIQEFHEGRNTSKEAVALSGHRGRDKLQELLRCRYFWPNMNKEARDFCKVCITCQKVNPATLKVSDPMHPVGVPSRVMAQIGVDLCQLPDVNGLKYVVVAIDYFSKWSEARGLPDKRATSVARFIYEDVVCRHGCPETIISDQGNEFCNQLMEELQRLTGTRHRVTSAYHPQANGLVERMNRSIKNALLKVLEGSVESWPDVLPGVLFAHRTSVHRSTRYSPFYVLYQRQPRLPMDVEFIEEDECPNNADDDDDALQPDSEDDTDEEPFDISNFVQVKSMCEDIREQIVKSVEKNIKNAQEEQRRGYNKHHTGGQVLKVGQEVLLINSRRRDRAGGKYLLPKTGPYTIEEISERKTVTLRNKYGVILKTKYPVSHLVPLSTADNHSQEKINEEEKMRMMMRKDDSRNEVNNAHDGSIGEEQSGKSIQHRPEKEPVERANEEEKSNMDKNDNEEKGRKHQEKQTQEKEKEDHKNVTAGIDLEQGDLKPWSRTLSKVPLLQNGNILRVLLKEGSQVIEVSNTCSFDALLHIYSSAYIQSGAFADFVESNRSNRFCSMIEKLVTEGVCDSLLEARAALLGDCFPTIVTRGSSAIRINANANVCTMAIKTMAGLESLIEEKTCSGESCPKPSTETRDLLYCTRIPVNGVIGLDEKIQAFLNHQYEGRCYIRTTKNVSLQDPDVEYYDNAIRCTGVTTRKSRIVGGHLLVEVMEANKERVGQCVLHLSEVPLTLNVSPNALHLRGVIEFIGGKRAVLGSMGHYKAHLLQHGQWKTYDDLAKEVSLPDTSRKLRCHVLVYTL